MKPKISLKLLLLLLSAITEANSRKYRNKNDRGIIHDWANSSSLMRANMANSSAVEKECHGFNQIAKWINYQVVLTGNLRRFNQRLGELLLGLNDTAPSGHCCFYEKATMEQVVQYLNSVARDQGSAKQGELKPLQLIGELGQDLDNILAQMGKLISQDIRSCCDQLAEGLEKQEEDLEKKLEELRRKLDKASGEQGKAMAELQQKHADLEKQLADLRVQMAKLEEKLRKRGESSSSKCCEKLDEKLRDLESQAKNDKNAAIDKAKEIEKKLDDLKDGQKDQEEKLDDIERKMNKRIENITKAMDMCKENCGKGTNAGTSDLETRVEALKKLVEDLSKMIADLTPSEESSDITESIKSCQKIGKLLASIETLLQQAIKGLRTAAESAGSSTNLEEQVRDLQTQVDRSRHCCKFLDGIGNNADHLDNNVKKKNETVTDHISDLEQKTGHLGEMVNDALEKIKNLTLPNGSGNGSCSDDLLTAIDRLQGNLKEIANLRTHLDNMMGHIAVLTKMIKDKLIMTEELKSRLFRLEKACEDLKKDVDKALSGVQRINDLEKLLDDALEKQKQLENQVNNCLSKCKALDSIDDLIDRIEDLEAKVKPKVPTTKRAKRTTWNPVWVGGIDNVTPFEEPK